jgi:acyl-CoA thioester hydrolase
MKKHIYKTRVRYAEVDQMGVVYYANYLAYLESGRTGLLRDEGFPYSEMEARGLLLPVMECHCKYKGAARYDEEISVETTLGYVKNASIKITYRIKNSEGEVIVTGYTVHPFVDRDWKIVSIPDEIKAVLAPYVAGA